jgi:iron complex transport system substrate-binding protein
MMQLLRRLVRPSLALPFLVLTTAVPANALELTDIAGRTVVLEQPAERVLLGEGRFLAALGAIGISRPLKRVAGMLNEFQRYDPTGFGQYRKAFPAIDAVPGFGHTSADSTSLEKAIALQPDAAIFSVFGHGPDQRAAHIVKALEAAGIPVLFVDFRQDPLGNTAPSIRLIGRLLGAEEGAEAFAAFHEAEVRRVTQRLEGADIVRPTVLLEGHVGLRPNCCFTMARGTLADLVAAAGGQNIASGILPGPVGMLNLEHVITAAPEIYIGTAVGAPTGDMAGAGRIILGPTVDTDMARRSLRAALQRPGIEGLPAVSSGRAYGIWHHFYNSPLKVYALQKFATWFHPDLFADLEPEKVLERMLKGFAPVDLQGTYAIRLEP